MKTISRNLLLLAMATGLALGEENTLRIWTPEERAKSYFPIWDSKTKTGIQDYTAQCATRFLRQIGEPCLRTAPKATKREVYRFSLLHWGDLFCVRMEREGDGFRLWAKRTDASANSLLEQYERSLSKPETAKAEYLLKNLDFFHMATEDKPFGVDGSCWILEGLRGRQYHVIKHWSPDVDPKQRGLTALYEFCKFLIMNDGLKKTPKNWNEYEMFRQ